jgi:hypothetical protein
MKKITLLTLLCLLVHYANAQFISDPGTNRPLYQSSSDVQGNPFFNSNWCDGSIISEKGINFTKMQLKFDVFRNELVFNINDSSFRFLDPVKEFFLNVQGSKGRNTVKFIKSSIVNEKLPGSFVQELAVGAIGFYKHYKKVVVEVTGYNMASKKSFEDRNTYYIVQNGTPLMVNLNKKSLELILGAKWQVVNAYMERNNLSVKSEAGWIEAINYFNTL